MDQLLAMRAFCCIVEARGFSAASERLGTTHSTVSRQLKQLETYLGVRLINRNTRTVTLTAAGESYYAASIDILERMDAASQSIVGEHQQPAGLLRISVPLVIGTLELANWLPGFQKAFPEIQIDLSCSDKFVDLVAGGFDATLRISDSLADSTLVAKELTVSNVILVAAPAYVNRHGFPQSVEQLAQHELLAYAGSGADAEWVLTSECGTSTSVVLRTRLKIDAITALHAAVIAGVGIAAFTQHTVQSALESGQLTRVLPGYTLGQRRYYLLFPHAKQLPAKVRVFIDFMTQHYRQYH